MTWGNYYRHYLQQLQHIYELQEASAITAITFESAALVTRKDLVVFPDQIVPQHVQMRLDSILGKLLLHTPVQYVLGKTIFYNRSFMLNEHVLIPRPETEELVQWVIDDNSKQQEIHMLDIGTGSGCIPIVLKKEIPQALITAADISREALNVARHNAQLHEAGIHFLELDFLNTAAWEQLPSFDVIVSNPPYIPVLEKEALNKNVTLHEPHGALFVPNQHPLIFYEAINEFAASHLNTNGIVYVEIHEAYGEETAAVFKKQFATVELKKDINGKDRMIKAFNFLQ